MLVLVGLVPGALSRPPAPRLPPRTPQPDLTVEKSPSTRWVAGSGPGGGTISLVVRKPGRRLWLATGSFQLEVYVDPGRAATLLIYGGLPCPIRSPDWRRAPPSAQISHSPYATQGCDHIVYAWDDQRRCHRRESERGQQPRRPAGVRGRHLSGGHLRERRQLVRAGALAPPRAVPRPTASATPPTRTWPDPRLGSSSRPSQASPTRWPPPNVVASCRPPGDPLRQRADGTPSWTRESGRWSVRPASGQLYFAKVANAATISGPLTTYSLTLTSATGVSDDYEPDNTCATTRHHHRRQFPAPSLPDVR